MATIALIWELGADMGHIGRLLPVALALRAQGHKPVLILRDISRAQDLLGSYDLEFHQAPVWLPPVQGLPPPVNYTETLFLFGFLTPGALLSIAKAWRHLLHRIQPVLLVLDMAPTALVATRGLGLPRVVVGNSFAVPPRVSPWPVYHWWDAPPPPQRLAATDARMLSTVNTVLANLGDPLLQSVHDIYDASATLITGSPELDVYGRRTTEEFIGAINMIDHGVQPEWPGQRSRRVFAYLKPASPGFSAVVKALAMQDASVLIYAAGIAPKQVQELQSANLRFSDHPLNMRATRAQCHLAVCQGGGTIDVMLEAGVPLLLLPSQTEQAMTSRKLMDMGCGLVWFSSQPESLLQNHLQRLLSDPGFKAQAQRHAERNKSTGHEFSVNRLVQTCQALLAPATTPTV
jgi:UDP:flavonoid glycosyltransferase YjiC (YdhE family)